MATTTLVVMINEAETLDEFRQAAMLVQDSIRRNVLPAQNHQLMDALAYRGHALIATGRYGASAMHIAADVMATLAVEPGQ